MDDPALDPRLHADALRGLAYINRLSGTARRVTREIARMARTRPGPVRVLDIACGGGDVLVDVGRWARRQGLEVELHGYDLSSRALERAEARARGAGISVVLGARDVLAEPLPEGFDLLTTCLFLHHLTEDDAVALLSAMAAAGGAILVQDLRRTRLGWSLAVLAGLFTFSSVVRVDGPRSVRAAFSLGEAESLCRRAGLSGAEVEACWPQRFTIRWRGPTGEHGR